MSKKNILDKITKEFDSKTFKRLSDVDHFSDVSFWYPTGVPLLDLKLNTLGFCPGIIEIAGPSMSGKTTLGLHSMGQFAKRTKDSGFLIILSSENRDNSEYAEILGVDPDEVLLVKSKFVEDLILKMQSLINKIRAYWAQDGNVGEPKFYVMWDSLGATMSRAEIETMDGNLEKMEKSESSGKGDYKLDHEQMASFAKNAKKMAKYLLAKSYDSIVSFIVINHVHDNIGSVGKKSGGGSWVEYMPTIRIRMVKIGSIKGRKEGEIIGQETLIEIVKSDYGIKHKFKVPLLFGYGFILSEEDIDFAIDEEIIDAPSSRVREALGGKLKWKSQNEFYDLYMDKKTAPLMKVLHGKIEKAYHEIVSSKHNKSKTK